MRYLITIPQEIRKVLDNHPISIIPLPESIVLGRKPKWMVVVGDLLIRTYGDTPEEALSAMESELVKLDTK